MRIVLFLAMLFYTQHAIAQTNWDWQVLDNGCYVLDPNGDPSRHCETFWIQRTQNGYNFSYCLGQCSVNPMLGLVCDQAPSMKSELIGQDHLAETPAVMTPPNPETDPGNITRKRFLKCIKIAQCRCLSIGGGPFVCSRNPMVPFVHEHATTFQGDLNGPDCEPPEQQEEPPSGP